MWMASYTELGSEATTNRCSCWLYYWQWRFAAWEEPPHRERSMSVNVCIKPTKYAVKTIKASFWESILISKKAMECSLLALCATCVHKKSFDCVDCNTEIETLLHFHGYDSCIVWIVSRLSMNTYFSIMFHFTFHFTGGCVVNNELQGVNI